MFFKKFIGSRSFYKRVLVISLPIMIQNGITNFVSLLDNIMVGRIGTEAMSGVSIVNQFIFVFNLMIFGAVSAAGIFTAQYHGSRDTDGERYTFRYKMIINTLAAIAAVGVFAVFSDFLISLFLHSGSAEGDLAITLEYGKSYLFIMLIGLLPYAISQVYASTMRETEETIVPMAASIVAVATNFILNYVLIFGKLGMPALGVKGAAIATVISRFAELAVLVIWAHTHKKKCPYLVGAYSSLRIPRKLFTGISLKGLPLMLNELLWALAVTLRNQAYSLRGLDTVASQNISSTVFNLFSVIYMAIGCSIAIIVGNELGAGDIESAKSTATKMITFSCACGVGLGLIMIGFSTLFPMLYNTTDTVRGLSAFMIAVMGILMPFSACAHSTYFTIRSGGRVFVTMLLDSVYMWVFVLPISVILSRFTQMDIHLLFIVCQGTEIVKSIFSIMLLKKGSWAKRLVGDGDRK